jgi:hypothetical protein
VSPDEPFVWGGYYETRSLIWRSRWVTRAATVECREALALPSPRSYAVLLRFDALEVGEREEQEAVRGPQGQGDVEVARRQDREFTRRVEARGEEVGYGRQPQARGTTAQHKAAGRKGGRAAAKKR